MTDASDSHLVKPLPRRQESPWLRRALVLMTLVLLVDALFGERGLVEGLRARRDYATARAALVQLQNANAGLRAQARRLTEDPAAIEAVAREELGLIRPGEILFVVRTGRTSGSRR